jgi:hypothetical protein
MLRIKDAPTPSEETEGGSKKKYPEQASIHIYPDADGSYEGYCVVRKKGTIAPKVVETCKLLNLEDVEESPLPEATADEEEAGAEDEDEGEDDDEEKD